MDEKEKDLHEIRLLIEKYYKKYHIKPEYKDGDRISYAARVYDEKEIIALVESALEFWLTSGKYTQQFEEEFAKYVGVKHCSLVNSGSSANLLAFMTLTSPLLKERAVHRGDEVITVAAGFPTTVAPIIQFGAIPVFVDVTIPQYNIDTDLMEKALSSKTKAVMIAHTLGNPFDLTKVKAFCDKHKLWLIEDNCDALGSEIEYDGKWVKTGTVGDIGTSSFYPPHHMTMGEGGAVYTNHALLHKIVRSLRDWGRDCMCPSGKDNFCRHRFEKQYGQLPMGYDHKYVYSHFGYNLKATDMQAAVGVEQLKKLPDFVKKRRENWKYLDDRLSDVKGIIRPQPFQNAKPSWFGYMITVEKPFERDKIIAELENNNIQTRNLFAGNLIKHPCFDAIRESDCYRIAGDLKNTDRIMKDTFWVGVYPGMSRPTLDTIARVICSCIKK